MKNKNLLKIILLAAILAADLAVLITFEAVEIRVCGDETANALWLDIIPRIVTGITAVTVIFFAGYGKCFKWERKGCLSALLWCIPCLAVAIVNFPFSALASGLAEITRHDLIWLFALKCLAIGFMEEAIFRGIILGVAAETIKEGKYKKLLTVAISSAIFALYHIFNLFAGAGAGATLLQVGYSFLTGSMFAATVLRTKSLYPCIILHAVFDFGGLIVTDLGLGTVHDNIFWILTAIAAVICFIHVIKYLLSEK